MPDDISDKLKELINDQERQFYKIIDAVPVSIYWKDKKGAYL